MKTDELREKYLEFFVSKGHRRCASDVLKPHWDSSVLFTPAGMNPFKDHFLGRVKLEFTRATSCQKCLRTGDIENVGRTAYHHTFFEMLGNFSFGDYFKREAIHWAWEFLTGKKWLGIDPGRLTVTVYLDDDEAANIWRDEIKLPGDRVTRMGEDDNFWPAGAPSKGPDGVCGPCSEIFYHGDDGGAVEIWNLVFTQFNRVGAPPDNLRPLPSKNIDTGMGLERIVSLMQNVDTNFHIDSLRPIVEAAAEICRVKYEPKSDAGRRLRRVADHVRACVMAIHENVYPGPNKEKYVVRRLLRRAVLDGHQLGTREPFLHLLVEKVVEMMRGPYPELAQTTQRVANVVRQEEQTFHNTLDAGLARVDKAFSDMRAQGRSVIAGDISGPLYATYGIPAEIVESLGAEHNFTFDWAGFRQWMESQAAPVDVVDVFATGPIEAFKKSLHRTPFLGYQATDVEAEIKGLVARDHVCEQVQEDSRDQRVVVLLDQSPFYGEAGGQVGDTGELVGPDFLFEVVDTKRNGDLILHLGHLRGGRIHLGDKVLARVDHQRRQAIRRAHSATHVLHHALQRVLGEHAQQQGSKVEADWLRFDFTNLQPVAPEQLEEIELRVQNRLREAAPVNAAIMPLAEARKLGAMMLFGEKYPDPVRVVAMGDFSKELCGGTHCESTADIDAFELLSEEGVSAGVRRVVALTGERAREHVAHTAAAARQIADKLGVSPRNVPEAVKDLVTHVRELKKQLSTGAKSSGGAKTTPAGAAGEPTPAQLKAALRDASRLLNVAPFDAPARVQALLDEVSQLQTQLAELAKSGDLSADALLERAEVVGGVRVVAVETPGANPNLMRQLIDQLRKKAAPIGVLLGARQGDDKVLLVAGLSHELVDRGISAGQWVGHAAAVVGGGGGGKPDMAQAGGKHPEKLAEAIAAGLAWMREKLA